MGHQAEVMDTLGEYCSGEDCSGLSGGNIKDDGAVQINEWLG